MRTRELNYLNHSNRSEDLTGQHSIASPIKPHATPEGEDQSERAARPKAQDQDRTRDYILEKGTKLRRTKILDSPLTEMPLREQFKSFGEEQYGGDARRKQGRNRDVCNLGERSVISQREPGLNASSNSWESIHQEVMKDESATVNLPDNTQLPGITRGTDSVTRWNEDPAAPWTDSRHTGAMGQSMMTPFVPGPATECVSQEVDLYGYRDARMSEVSATTPGRYSLDFGTNRNVISHSEGSMDHPDRSSSCSSNIMDLNGLDFKEKATTYGAESNTSLGQKTMISMTCTCDGCGHISKNNSEYKYVILFSLSLLLIKT